MADPLGDFMAEVKRRLRRLDSRVTEVSQESPPPGFIGLYPRASITEPPDGFARPNGQAINADDDPECARLYGANLPDLPAPKVLGIDPSDTLQWLVRLG